MLLTGCAAPGSWFGTAGPAGTAASVPGLSDAVSIASSPSGSFLAESAFPSLAMPAPELPDLPAADDGPGHFSLDGHSASVGYRTGSDQWRAQVNGFGTDERSLSLGYGALLAESVGTGVRLTHSSGYSEVLFKGVFAPEENTRIHLAGSRLGRVDGDALAYGIRPDSVSQDSLLLGLNRRFGERQQLTDIGLAAYSINASGRLSPDLGRQGERAGAARGAMAGYLLEFGFRPTQASRIEYRRELDFYRYGLGDSLRSAERLVSNRVGYFRHFDNCLRFCSGYRASPYGGRVDIGVARNNWNVAIARAFDDAGADTAIRIGYAIPLGASGDGSGSCSDAPAGASAFESMIDAALRRPAQFLSEPVLTTDLE